jgi:hypothetical protein
MIVGPSPVLGPRDGGRALLTVPSFELRKPFCANGLRLIRDPCWRNEGHVALLAQDRETHREKQKYLKTLAKARRV